MRYLPRFVYIELPTPPIDAFNGKTGFVTGLDDVRGMASVAVDLLRSIWRLWYALLDNSALLCSSRP